MLAAFRPLPEGGVSGILLRPRLRPPNDLDTAAEFLHRGAERLEADRRLSNREIGTLLTLARRGEIAEPDNPFWPMSTFVFHDGKGEIARKAWGRASRCKRYNDHQRHRILSDVDLIAAKVGDTQGWMYAAVAPLRSDAILQRIRKNALAALRGFQKPLERLDFAYETIRNGAMIRDGSERLDLGRIGIAIIEAAPYPPNAIPGGKSPIARLYIAKTSLTAELRKRGRVAEAAFCDRQFRTNDSWAAFTSVERPERRFQALALASVYAATLPGGLTAVALAGGALWIIGLRLGVLAHHSHVYRGPGVAATSLALLIAGFTLGYLPIGLAAGLCALVPAFSPERPKRYSGQSLGPLHVLVVSSMGIIFALTLVVATVSRTLPGSFLPQFGRSGALLGDGPRWGAIGVVVLGASALVAPAWAYVRRYPTTEIAAKTYRGLGRGIAIPALVLAVIASPLSLAADRWLGNSLAKIVQNEQYAYNPRGLESR